MFMCYVRLIAIRGALARIRIIFIVIELELRKLDHTEKWRGPGPRAAAYHLECVCPGIGRRLEHMRVSSSGGVLRVVFAYET